MIQSPKAEHLLYLDYVNNFLTVEKWAEHHQLEMATAERIITTYRPKKTKYGQTALEGLNRSQTKDAAD